MLKNQMLVGGRYELKVASRTAPVTLVSVGLGQNGRSRRQQTTYLVRFETGATALIKSASKFVREIA